MKARIINLDFIGTGIDESVEAFLILMHNGETYIAQQIDCDDGTSDVEVWTIVHDEAEKTWDKKFPNPYARHNASYCLTDILLAADGHLDWDYGRRD